MSSFIKRVLFTAFVAGTLDILCAYIQVYITTQQVSKKMFHYIAGGALGLDVSMKGGNGVMMLGIFIHYFIAFVFTLIFFRLFPKVKALSYNKYVTGLVYGISVWTIMNLLVLPLSKLPPAPLQFQSSIIGMLIIMVMVGLPIAISAYDYYTTQRRTR
jgi:hypothetical protein